MWSECRCVAGPLSALCHRQKTLLLVGGGHAALPSLPQIYSSRGRRPSSGHSLCHAGKSPPHPRLVCMDLLLHGASPLATLPSDPASPCSPFFDTGRKSLCRFLGITLLHATCCVGCLLETSRCSKVVCSKGREGGREESFSY